MKIYTLEEGAYSERSLEGVFTSLEDAQQACYGRRVYTGGWDGARKRLVYTDTTPENIDWHENNWEGRGWTSRLGDFEIREWELAEVDTSVSVGA